MTDRALREKIEGLPRFDGNGIHNLGALISRYAVLAILDAHTAAQPAPSASESYICRTCRRHDPAWQLCAHPACPDGR